MRLTPDDSLRTSSIWTEILWICILMLSISVRRSAIFLRLMSVLILNGGRGTYASFLFSLSGLCAVQIEPLLY